MNLSLDRLHSLAGRDTLDWFFANRKWIRLGQNSLTEVAYAKRPLPVDDRSSKSEAAIRFLLLASKRNYKRAHDRNKIKRWLRASIAEIPEFPIIESQLAERGEQLLVMLKISKPVRDITWPVILEESRKIAEQLSKRV